MYYRFVLWCPCRLSPRSSQYILRHISRGVIEGVAIILVTRTNRLDSECRYVWREVCFSFRSFRQLGTYD
jgi:hypothetical protein